MNELIFAVAGDPAHNSGRRPSLALAERKVIAAGQFALVRQIQHADDFSLRRL
jgi:hypothetical protein